MSTPVHILVVDDIPQNMVATEALLARPGVTVLTAACGRASGCKHGSTVFTIPMPRQAAGAA